MIQYLLFGTSKLLNISEITKRIGNFFKLPIQLFYSISYPELALMVNYSVDKVNVFRLEVQMPSEYLSPVGDAGYGMLSI